MITLAICISLYITFKKMGLSGYLAFVPVYNLYLLYKKGYKTSVFWVVFGLLAFAGIMLLIFISSVLGAYYGSRYPSFGSLLLAIPCLIAAGVLDIIARYSIVRSFTEKKGLAVFSIFFEGITWIILGFDKEYQYLGNWQDRKKASSASTSAV